MGYTYGHGGLLVPEGAAEAAVSRQLKEYDPDLRLVPQDSDAYGQRIYKVYKHMGDHRPALFILLWGDEHGNPFPLSSALVEEVKRYDRGGRGYASLPDPDVENRRLHEKRRKETEETMNELGREFDPYVTGRRSFGVRIGRDL